MKARSGIEWVRALLISFSVVTFAVTQPVYQLISSNEELSSAHGLPLMWVVLLFQIVPTAAVWGLDRAIAAWSPWASGLRAYRTVLFVGAFLLFLRQMQVFADFDSHALPDLLLYLLLFAVLTLVVVLCLFAYRALTVFLVYLSVAAAILTGVFVQDVGLHYDAWGDSEAGHQPPLSKQLGKPVFVLIFDELALRPLLKEDEIDGGRYPNFKTLAGDSVWFRNASTNYLNTKLSIPSFLLGERLVLKHSQGQSRNPSQAPEFETIQQFVQTERFQQQNVLSALASYYLVDVYGEALDYCDDSAFSCHSRPYTTRTKPLRYLETVWITLLEKFVPVSKQPLIPDFVKELFHGEGWPGAGKVDRFEAFLDRIDASEARSKLYYYHSLLPHRAFIYDEEGRRHNSPHVDFDTAPKGKWPLVYENYVRQTVFVDFLLGRFISKLKSEGLYEEAVIVVTSDHGLETDRLVPGDYLPEEANDLVMRIPMIIHAPGLEPEVSDAEYQHIDFKATLLDVLGLPTGQGEGVSAFATEGPVRDQVVYACSEGICATYSYDRGTETWRLSGT